MLTKGFDCVSFFTINFLIYIDTIIKKVYHNCTIWDGTVNTIHTVKTIRKEAIILI